MFYWPEHFLPFPHGHFSKNDIIYTSSYVCILRDDISSLTPGHVWEERKEVQEGQSHLDYK